MGGWVHVSKIQSLGLQATPPQRTESLADNRKKSKRSNRLLTLRTVAFFPFFVATGTVFSPASDGPTGLPLAGDPSQNASRTVSVQGPGPVRSRTSRWEWLDKRRLGGDNHHCEMSQVGLSL